MRDLSAQSVCDIPSVDRLMNSPALRALEARVGRTHLLTHVRAHVAQLRRQALDGGLPAHALTLESIHASLETALTRQAQPQLRPVFNLTGTVLHTNLGRAVLPEEALQAIVRAASAPVNLEFDLEAGRRGERDALIESLVCELTGAQAATVVNNNAAAVLLMLSALASRRDVVISRGELVEIGGAFRLPDIMRQAGARLVEVGTTNRTHLADYEQAMGSRTALLLKAHTSNYKVIGFTASVPERDLAALARERGVPFAVDLGSGSLIDLTRWGLPKEPTVQETLAGGADLVSFSGDKLLGGPQAGVLVGRADLIAKLKKHPLKRAVRVGKLTLAALEAVLQLYRAPDFLSERLVTLRWLTRPQADIRAQAERLAPTVQAALAERCEVAQSPMFSQIGSGALPVEHLPSYGLTLRPLQKRGALERVDAALRALPRPVVGRVQDKMLWLDLRCLEPADEPEFAAQCNEMRA